MAMTMGLDPRFEKCLNSLGSIRNNFAHNLKTEITVEDTNNLYASLDGEIKETVNSYVSKVAKKHDLTVTKHKEFSPKQQFSNIVVIIASALHSACKQAT
ncbi:hypothetical protein IMCC1989_2338 [gamma proteobacterium IMCC1989]|nr:hypothetical protein IMCC1989_2338 [gamma proteobacterium IMCC1989]